MAALKDVMAYLAEFAPFDLAEEWDNVGLLLGEIDANAERVMTCLTLTPDVAAEAIREKADLVVSHHPILFRAAKRINTGTSEGRMLLDLIRANISVYSPHTAFDNALEGINAQLANRLGLRDVRPLRPLWPRVDAAPSQRNDGSGRYGELPERMIFHNFLQRVLTTMGLTGCAVVAADLPVRRIGVACGSAAEFLTEARTAGCDVFITGEARFHAALEARTSGIGLILLGHYASERFAMESLAETLAGEFSDIAAWASEAERDPLQYVAAG